LVDTAAPVIAGMRLRAGRTGSGKGAGRMVAQAIATARAAGVSGSLLVRGDAAYGTLPAFAILTTPPRCNGEPSNSWASPTATAWRSQYTQPAKRQNRWSQPYKSRRWSELPPK
jgi:hypothetical protein